MSSIRLRSGMATAAMMIGSSSGYLGLTVLPLWAGAVVVDYGVSVQAVGLIGSLQLAAAAIASLWASKAIASYDLKGMAVFAAVIIVIANILCIATESLVILCIGRAFSGLGEGLLLSVMNTWITAKRDPDKLFAGTQITLGIISIFIFFGVPKLMVTYGAAGVFGSLAFVASLAVVLLLVAMPKGGQQVSEQTASSTKRISLAGYAGLLVVGCMFAGIQGVWLYLERMGNVIGLETTSIGNILALGALLAMVGPTILHRVGNRFGRLVPIVTGLGLIMMATLLVTSGQSQTAYAVGAASIQTIVLFNIAAFMGLLAYLDNSGRTAAAGPAFINIGSAIGPAVASLILGLGGYQMVGMYAVGLFICAAIFAYIALKISASARVRVLSE